MTDVAKAIDDLQRAAVEQNARLAQYGYSTKFNVQPMPQAGHACRARFLVSHTYTSGAPISRTEVAIGFDGQVAALHPRFRWNHDGRSWGELLAEIVGQDLSWLRRRR